MSARHTVPVNGEGVAGHTEAAGGPEAVDGPEVVDGPGAEVAPEAAVGGAGFRPVE